MKKYIFLVGLLVTGITGWAQQTPQYSQYIFNSAIINPAYVGSKELWQVNTFYRTQWTSLTGRPETQTLAADGAVANNRLGLGVLVINDRIGAEQHRTFQVSGSSKVQINQNSFLRLGLNTGLQQYRLDLNKIRTDEAEPDPVFTQQDAAYTTPDIGLGVYFHSDVFYAGFSGQNLVQFQKDPVISPRRHFYLTSGYVLEVNPDFKVKPSFLIKEDFNGPTSTDISAFVLFRELIWAGLTYRSSLNMFGKNNLPEDLKTSGAIAYLAEFYPTDNIRIGYAYDVSVVPEFRNLRTHEISIGYLFRRKNDPTTLTPRFF